MKEIDFDKFEKTLLESVTRNLDPSNELINVISEFVVRVSKIAIQQYHEETNSNSDSNE